MKEKQEIYLSNVWKLYFIRAMRGSIFVAPILVLFYQQKGLSLTEISFLYSIFFIIVIAFEVPSGYIADIIGKKNAIILSSLLGVVGYLIYSISSGFALILVGEIALALSYAFISGADSALLYDSLKIANKENEYKKHISRLFAIYLMAESISSIIGAYIASYSLVWTFYISAFMMFIGLLISASLKDTNNKLESSLEIIKAAGTVLKSNRKFLLLIIYGSGIVGAGLMVYVLWQPYIKTLDFDIKYLGVIWAAYNISMAMFALQANGLEKAIGTKNVMILLSALPVIAGVLLYTFEQKWIIIAFLLYAFSFAISNPIIQHLINSDLPSISRATLLSVYNLMSNIPFIILSPLIGYIADIYNLQSAFLASSIIFGLFAILALIPILRTLHKKV